jgi:hypothetical protein
VSSVPVSAFQFNPLCCNFNYSNDASLLLPDQVAGEEYIVLSLPHWADRSGFFTVVAVADGTHIDIELPPSLSGRSAVINAGNSVHFDDEGRAQIRLNAYQSWTVRTRFAEPLPDLTGTRLQTRGGKILVYGGHEATQVPTAVTAPDHLEEMVPPLDTWGRAFVIPRPILRNPASPEERTYYRFLAGKNGARIRLITPDDRPLGLSGPAADSAADCRALRDEHGLIVLGPRLACGLGLRASFRLQADRPILVGQLLAGQAATGLDASDAAGDPSFSIIPPVDQLRADYLFTIPPTYARDYVTIAAPASAEITLDGVTIDFVAMADAAVEPFLVEPRERIGNSSWVRFTVRIGDGAHRLSSRDPSLRFGVMVYAFDSFVSYSFPAGMNLAKASR